MQHTRQTPTPTTKDHGDWEKGLGLSFSKVPYLSICSTFRLAVFPLCYPALPRVKITEFCRSYIVGLERRSWLCSSAHVAMPSRDCNVDSVLFRHPRLDLMHALHVGDGMSGLRGRLKINCRILIAEP
jgi:hypothetical protein